MRGQDHLWRPLPFGAPFDGALTCEAQEWRLWAAFAGACPHKTGPLYQYKHMMAVMS